MVALKQILALLNMPKKDEVVAAKGGTQKCCSLAFFYFQRETQAKCVHPF